MDALALYGTSYVYSNYKAKVNHVFKLELLKVKSGHIF